MALAAVGTVLLTIGAVALVAGLGYLAFAPDDTGFEVHGQGAVASEAPGTARSGFYITGAGLLVGIVGIGLALTGQRIRP